MNHKLPLPFSESLCNIVNTESASSSRVAFRFTRFCVWCINSCNFCRWMWSSILTWRRATKQTTKQKNVTANSTQWEKNVSWTFSWQKSLISLWEPKTTAFAVQNIRELKQPRRRRQQKTHKFAYLTMKNSIFALFSRAYFIFWHFEDVLVLSMTWNDLFCSCVDDVSIWWQMLIFVFLCPKHWFQFNSRIVRTHFSSIMTLSNWKMIAEPRIYIFRWRSRFRRRRVCLSSLMWLWRPRLLNALTLIIFDLRSFPVVNFSTLIDLVFSWLAVILRLSEPFRMEFKPLRYQNNRVKWR